MDGYVWWILWYFIPLCLLFHLLCFVFIDADFTLMRANLLGSKPGEFTFTSALLPHLPHFPKVYLVLNE